MRAFRVALQISLFAFAIALSPAVRATTTTLYTATSGLPPGLPQWFGSSSGGAPSVSVVSSTYLDFSTSASNQISAAYLLLSPAQTLETVGGYDLSFRLQITAETHTSTNRGGFSFIAIGSNTTESLELTFWTDHVWAYNYSGSFSHGPDYAFDATLVHDYILRVQNQNFTLLVDGSPVLSGPLQDYLLPSLPYQIANTIIFGDDTTEASSDIHLYNVTFDTDLIPEPSSFAMVGIALLGVVALRRRS